MVSDKTAKIDQYVGDDCTKQDGSNDCTYVIDSMQSTSEAGFPAPIELPNGDFDRSKPMHYALLVMTSPFRIAKDYAIKNGSPGRKNEKQLFWTPRSKTWEDHPFNYTFQGFQSPGSSPRPVFDKYQFVHAMSRANHPEIAKQLHRGFRGWYPILERMDEYFLLNPAYTRVDYVVAYQRQ